MKRLVYCFYYAAKYLEHYFLCSKRSFLKCVLCACDCEFSNIKNNLTQIAFKQEYWRTRCIPHQRTTSSFCPTHVHQMLTHSSTTMKIINKQLCRQTRRLLTAPTQTHHIGLLVQDRKVGKYFKSFICIILHHRHSAWHLWSLHKISTRPQLFNCLHSGCHYCCSLLALLLPSWGSSSCSERSLWRA